MMIFIKVSVSCWFIGGYIFLKLGSAEGTMFVFFEVDTTRYSRPHVRNKIFLQEKLLLAKQISVFTSRFKLSSLTIDLYDSHCLFQCVPSEFSLKIYEDITEDLIQ